MRRCITVLEMRGCMTVLDDTTPCDPPLHPTLPHRPTRPTRPTPSPPLAPTLCGRVELTTMNMRSFVICFCFVFYIIFSRWLLLLLPSYQVFSRLAGGISGLELGRCCRRTRLVRVEGGFFFYAFTLRTVLCLCCAMACVDIIGLEFGIAGNEIKIKIKIDLEPDCYGLLNSAPGPGPVSNASPWPGTHRNLDRELPRKPRNHNGV
jgi:hypothetical protein